MKSQAIGLIMLLLLVGGFVANPGCARNSTSNAKVKPTVRSRTESRSGVLAKESSIAKERRAVDLPELSQVVLAKATNPALEGWTTEAFSTSAMSQLKKLGADILGRSPDHEGPENSKQTDRINRSQVDALFAGKFSCDALIPANLETVFNDHLFHVRRSTKGTVGRETRGAPTTTFADASRPLTDWLTNVPLDMRFKFKLFRVSVDDRDATLVTTRQYVQFAGKSSQESRELNATWVIEWERSNGPPLIRSIRVDSYEDVVSSMNRLFTDCTQSVLGKNESYEQALLPGIAHWRSRLEQQMGVYNFGHHGLAVGDVNADGLEDLYVCQTGGLPNHLFVQGEDGTLRETSATAGVNYLDNTRSALFLDIDNDDDQDLVLALTTGLLLLENNGVGVFQVRARMPSVRQAFSLAAADFDQDGLLDLYVCVYYGNDDGVSELPVPVPYFDAKNGGENHLIRNDGNWTFSNVTNEVGLDDQNRRFSFAAVWEDYDLDGDPDLMVVNDSGPNQLYQNQQGKFRNVAQAVGLIDGAFGMSATFGDYDRDGLLDLYVSNMFSAAGNRVTFQPQFKSSTDEPTKARFQHLARGNSLFRSTGNGRFHDVSVSQGVTMGRWSWGSLFADINNDGWDDLLVGNGFVTGESKDDL